VSNAPARPPPANARGALTLDLGTTLFGPLLPALVRDHVGNVTGWARAEPAQTTGELSVKVR
jgi:hypothetical protein